VRVQIASDVDRKRVLDGPVEEEDQPGAIRARSTPATAGPTIVASQTCAVASELAARRPSLPPTWASIVYCPALPQLVRGKSRRGVRHMRQARALPSPQAPPPCRGSLRGADNWRERAPAPDDGGSTCRARAPHRTRQDVGREREPDEGTEFAGGRGPYGQLAAFFTSAVILASSVAVNSCSANSTGQMAPSSRFALSLKPNVAYLVLNFSAGLKKQRILPSLA
jgi:hypothetical protein